MAGHCEPESLPLAVFVREHGHSLPLKIQVEEGFYGKDERSVISSGDVYNFHFIRNTKTMSIQDSCGTHYSIPFNSSITFGLVYNPFNEPFHAVRQYSFTTAGEIMTCKHPPPIFRATREFITRDTKSSIAKEEIFILKKVCRSGKKKKQHIRVHSLKTGDEKMLYRECEGLFQTDPGSVRLYLPEIAEYFKDQLPLVARIFLNSDVTDDCISSLVSDVVTLTHISVESSIIATTCWDDDNSDSDSLEEITDADNQKIPIAIPVDLSIEVSIIKSRPGNNEELYQMTRHLFEGFQLTKVKDMKEDDMSADDPRLTLQRTLNRSVRLGHEKQGVVIEKPTKVYKKKSKASNRDDSKVKPLELKPPTLQETAERMHKERRLPSISYSTFTNVPRRLTADPTRTPAYGGTPMASCDHYSGPKVQETIQRSYSPTPPPAGPCSELPIYSNMDSSHYDVPRKQSQAAVSDPLVGHESLKDVHLELLKPVPCPVVPNLRGTGNVSPHRSANACKDSDCMNKDSLLQESANCTISETDYDVPKSVKTDIPPPQHTTSTMHTSNSQQNSSLSELIRNHPLLKTPKLSDEKRDPELKSGQPECKGQSSLSTHTSRQNKQQFSEPALPRSAPDTATASNPSRIRLAEPMTFGAPATKPKSPGRSATMSSACEEPMTFTRKAHTNTCTSHQPESPVAHELGSPAPATKPKSPGRSATILSSESQKQSITYSEILTASMSRAQTLIARNIQELKRLDCQEVQVLLDNMNLGQYKQHFFSEGIDGEILAECDEHVLLYELHISSELHRAQLMNIIQGKQSVALILSGRGIQNYVRLSVH